MFTDSSVASKAAEIAAARSLRLRGIAEGVVLAGPQTVHIDVANGCNTNCVTCWDHSPLLVVQRSGDWKRQRMSVDLFRRIADDLATMKSVESVILSGMGDPFVNPDIYGIIEIAKQKGWHVTLLTNALLADPELVLSLGVDMMLISVNGVSPESYTAFHPNLDKSDFDRLLELLARFREAGKRFKHVQVINRDTADEVPEMVRFAARYSASHITYKLASLGRGTEACSITEQQRRHLMDELIPQAEEEARRLDIETNLSVFQSQVAAGGLVTAPIKDAGCFMGWTYARITVEGTILYCCSTEVRVGSLADGSFSEQWFGRRWNTTRERLMAGKYYSSCAQCGKLNQNIKIGLKVRERLGDEIYFARTGRGRLGRAQ